MTDRNLSSADYVVRGIMIGGAVGVFGALLGFSRSLFWGAGIGMIAGCFAGITMYKRMQKRKAEREKKQ